MSATATAIQTGSNTNVATATLPSLSGTISATIIEEVFDIVAAHIFETNDDAEEARKEAENRLINALTALSYPKTKFVPSLLESHWVKMKRSGRPLTAPAAPSSVSREIATFIEPAIVFKTAVNVSALRPQVSAEEVTQVIEAQVSSGNAPNWLSLKFDPGQTASLDALINQATSKKVDDIATLMDLARSAFHAVEERKAIQASLAEQKAKLEAGEVDEAVDMVIDMAKSFPTSPITSNDISKVLARPINTELSIVSGGQLDDIEILLDLVIGVEATIKTMDADINTMRRENRQLMPRSAVSEAEVNGVRCEIVIRRASDLFQNAYDGTDSMLDFDVPTAVFEEEHPDVPAFDATYHFFAPHLADCLHSIVRNKICAFQGESGSGKSEFVLQIGACLGLPVFRLNMDSHLTRADLIGQHKIIQSDDGKPVTKFIDGILPRALSQPSIILIDEWDAAHPEIMPLLQPVLEGRGVMILEDGARYVKPHPYSRIVLTGNTNGRGSSNAAYNNIHEQSAATIDRIEKILRMPYLPPDLEQKVVEARITGVDSTFVAKLIQLANKIREAYDSGETQQLCSTRTVMAAAERYRDFASMYDNEVELIATTLDVTLLNFCSETDRTTVKGLIDGIF